MDQRRSDPDVYGPLPVSRVAVRAQVAGAVGCTFAVVLALALAAPLLSQDVETVAYTASVLGQSRPTTGLEALVHVSAATFALGAWLLGLGLLVEGYLQTDVDALE